MDRESVVLAMTRTFGATMSVREIARRAGIPERTFRRLMGGVSGGNAAPFAAPFAALGQGSTPHQEPIPSPVAPHLLPQETPQATPKARKAPQVLPHPNAPGPASGQGSLFPDAAGSAAAPPSVLNKTKSERKGTPWRERDPQTLGELGQVLHDFDTIHHGAYGRGAGGNWGKATALIKNAIARGFTRGQLRQSIEYFHGIEGEWEAGHKIDTWAAGIDRYVDLAEREAAGARRAHYVDLEAERERERDFLERVNGHA